MLKNNPDAETLHDVLRVAGRLLPVYAERRAPKWRLLPDGSISVTRCITTPEQLDYALAHGVVCYGFFPTDAHLIVIDIDRNHTDGIDGFITIAERLPDISLLLRACTSCSTPHGGLHAYFKYSGAERYCSETIMPGVEVKHAGALATAPGSLHPDSLNPYRMGFGTFSDCIDITQQPFFRLLSLMHLHRSSPGYKPPVYTPRRQYNGSTTDRAAFIIRTICNKHTTEGRQYRVYCAAQWATREGISQADIETAIMAIPEFLQFAQEDPDGFNHAMRRN
ncbi:MAG: bifunctional DNA primase/polymerase [Treponema sp.]|nr:bifunctional DNA primase/polymerase [Treponema sp.]